MTAFIFLDVTTAQVLALTTKGLVKKKMEEGASAELLLGTPKV